MFGTTFHNVAGPGLGNSEWTRVGASIGPRYRLRAQSLTVDLKALAALGAFWVKGRGYATDTSNTSAAVGAGAGVRVALERSVLSPWIALDAMFWPGNHTIAVANVADTRTIPSLDSAGVARLQPARALGLGPRASGSAKRPAAPVQPTPRPRRSARRRRRARRRTARARRARTAGTSEEPPVVNTVSTSRGRARASSTS